MGFAAAYASLSALSSYGREKFDQAIADFSVAYADQNEKDHAAFKRAVREGNVQAVLEKVQ